MTFSRAGIAGVLALVAAGAYGLWSAIGPVGGATAGSTPSARQPPRPRALWIRGESTLEAGKEHLTLDPVFEVDMPPGLEPSPNDHGLLVRLTDRAGVELARHRLDVLEATDTITPWGSFSLFARKRPAARISIELDGIELVAVSASRNAPTLSITSPQAGEAYDGVRLPAAWRARDADGDALHVMIEYSVDGVRWELLVMDDPRTSLVLQTEGLAGSDSAFLRIHVSDGFHSVSEEVGPFKLAKHRPSVWIKSPEAGVRFVGDMSLILSARVSDAEDGPLRVPRRGGTVVWTSDRDGKLGTGDLQLSASDLSPGRHILKATAVDADGMTGSEHVFIEIAPY